MRTLASPFVFVFTLLSRFIDWIGPKGVLTGPVGTQVNAAVRLAYMEVAAHGPNGAVYSDVSSMILGLGMLVVGETSRLARAMRQFRGSMDYVYEKKKHGKVQPDWDFPMRALTGQGAAYVVENFPEEFVRVLENAGFVKALSAFFSHAKAVAAFFVLWPVCTCLVIRDVALFVLHGMYDVPDAQNFSLCQLAVMQSGLSNEAKDKALYAVRLTAPKTGVQFLDYVPLVVPLGGTEVDKARPRSAAGEIIDDHVVMPSVFEPRAVQLSQSVNAELFSLRSFLWLYRDEVVARDRCYEETVRKFGPETARRIAASPTYPLPPRHLSLLNLDGPRPAAEITAVLDGLLRARGLAGVAEEIAAGQAPQRNRG